MKVLCPNQYYPSDVAPILLARWPAANNLAPSLALLETGLLTNFISVAYQANLLVGEGQPMTCRLLLAAPEVLAAQPAAGTSYHFLAFEEAHSYPGFFLQKIL